MGKCCCHINGIEIKDSKARPVANITALKVKKNLAIGDVITTKGYYAENDYGGASYLIRQRVESDVDDGGKIHFLSDNSLVAELLVEPCGVINVKQFGLKNNSAFVNDERMKALLESGLPFVMDNGTYLFNETIEVPSYTYMKLINATILTNAKTGILIGTKEKVIIETYNSKLKFIEMKEENVAISGHNSSNVKISGLTLENYDVGCDLLYCNYVILNEIIFVKGNALGVNPISVNKDTSKNVSLNNCILPVAEPTIGGNGSSTGGSSNPDDDNFDVNDWWQEDPNTESGDEELIPDPDDGDEAGPTIGG